MSVNEGSAVVESTPITGWGYEVRHYQLVHNLVTDRYGWFCDEDGKLDAWYADKEAALDARKPIGNINIEKR